MATQPRLTTTCSVVISPLLYVPHSCAVVATLQAAAPLVAKPLIGFTYRATVATFPGAFLLMVSAVALPCACALFAVTWGLKGGIRDLAACLLCKSCQALTRQNYSATKTFT